MSWQHISVVDAGSGVSSLKTRQSLTEVFGWLWLARVDARLGKWTVITCNFSREEIAEHMDVRIASRLGRGNNVIVDGICVRDYSTRCQKEVA